MVNAGHLQARQYEMDAQAFIAYYLEIHQEQVRSARLDLDRLRSLIDDASARLLESFDVIGTFSKSRRVAALDGFDVMNEDVERAVGNAISAMQFQDMATQLVGHAAQRMALLEKIAESLSRMPEAPIAELAAAVANATCGRRSPVEQAGMAGGAVELF